jgi:hypothetical protein
MMLLIDKCIKGEEEFENASQPIPEKYNALKRSKTKR